MVRTLHQLLGLKEALGPLDTLGGHVDLREAGQHVQPAVLLQFSCSGLVEYKQELRGKVGKGQSQRHQEIYGSL